MLSSRSFAIQPVFVSDENLVHWFLSFWSTDNVVESIAQEGVETNKTVSAIIFTSTRLGRKNYLIFGKFVS